MPSFVLIHPAFGHNRYGPGIIWAQAKPVSVYFESGTGGCCAAFRGGAESLWG